MQKSSTMIDRWKTSTQCHVVEKITAVFCALCFATGVMSSVVFARTEDDIDTEGDIVAEEEEPSEEIEDLPEAVFIVLEEDAQEVDALTSEVTDNRDTVPYYVNGYEKGQCDLIDGVPYVSVTEFCSALGVNIHSTVSGTTLDLIADGLTLTASAGDLYFCCNGRYLYVEGLVQSIDETICLPVESLAGCLGVSVTWDRAAWYITMWTSTIQPLESGDTYYDANDLYWLSRVINAEAGNQSLKGQIAVGNVVLNRVADDYFAGQDTVYDVIFAKNQFDVVVNGMVYMTPSESAVIAAKLALEGTQIVPGATFFATYNFGSGYQCVAWIEDHCFMCLA